MPDGVSLIPTASGDEAIFLVGPDQAARMQEASLTAALTGLLGRKVWIVTNASGWREAPVPLPSR
ncbi:hypothetical protein [Conexibacter woesei]|uniref:hypothetical protein n=1 Tax=Conexibacter woesei TaxID=191495 RepID=UPI0003FD6230|nr:hypothetical protein [Conexibacter woesei]